MQKEDSLKIRVNEEGNYVMEWDKDDPNWNFLNGLTSKEIQTIIEQSINDDKSNDF